MKYLKMTVFLLSLVSLMLILDVKEAGAIASWSRKYGVFCVTCHSQVFARLNTAGEKFLWNGYQDQDNEKADGNEAGKKSYGERLSLEKEVGHWFFARLNVTPLQIKTNDQVVKGDTTAKYTLGNTNWMQLFVAGSISKNISIYIENEFEADKFHIAWYYLGLHNIFNSKWVNVQLGRLGPVVFAPYSDRLPQLPAVSGGVMRIKSSNGTGQASVDMRSPRYGFQYYGYQGPAMVYGGITTGGAASFPGNIGDLGYWAGLRVLIPEMEGFLAGFEGSSVGIHYQAGTDLKNASTATRDCSLTPPSTIGIPAKRAAVSMPRIPAASICLLTIRPVICPLSICLNL